MKKTYDVCVEDSKKRLDVFVSEREPLISRSHVKTLIENKKILLNGKAKKSGEMIKDGDHIEIELDSPQQIELEPENIDFEIVYQDKDLLVINKPQGLVVHPCQGTKNGTLVNGLLAKVQDLSGINGEIRPGIVHRLDKNTSGLMLVAKNDLSHRSLAKQIETKTCKRKYYALLEGVISKDEGRISTYIARSKSDRKKMAVCKEGEGKLAISDFVVVKRFAHFTLCEFSLQTGRTHQIRVHAKHMGHPVVGDEIYGKKDKKFGLVGQLLHSHKIEFLQPSTNEPLSFESELPPYFVKVLSEIS